MIIKVILILCQFFIQTKGAWNITQEGFLLNSLKYSRIRNTDYFSIVFRTKEQNGILLYCIGNENYLLMELYHAVIRISIKYIGQVQQEPYEGYIGSGLGDNLPHQIEIYREPHQVMLVLDRGERQALVSWPVVSSTELLFYIDRAYIGGFNNMRLLNRYMSLSKVGFNGCIEEAIWNNVNLLFEPYQNSSWQFCSLANFEPISFVTPQSYMTLSQDSTLNGFNLIFNIILYLNDSTILFHNDSRSTLNISISEGSFFMTLDFEGINYIKAFLPSVKVNDGHWHRIVVQLPGANTLEEPIVVYGVDNEIVTTLSYFSYNPEGDIKLGGNGFVGCLNNIVLNGQRFSMENAKSQKNLEINGCLFPDQCVPNPCQHSGFCLLGANSFDCICPESYPGPVCDDAKYFFSCANSWLCGVKTPGKQFIDTDSVGPYDPVGVLCNNMEDPTDKTVITQVDTLLPGGKIVLKNEPTTFDVPYALSREELRLLTLNSEYCTQQVSYECSNSNITNGNITLLVWQGPDGEAHHYWNSNQEYATCECYFEQQKCSQNKRCNCNAGDRITRSDSTTFNNLMDLPIVGITAMDISSADGKSATVEIGPLLCSGISKDLISVTFQEIFSYLPLPTLNFANPGTIQFFFKTDRAQGNVMFFVQGRPNTEYYVIELTNSSAVTVYFSFGHKKYVLSIEKSPYTPRLDDMEYHRIFFKVNHKFALLLLDEVSKKINIEYDYREPVQINKDNTPMYIGGSPYNMFSGFRGTISRLSINGATINLPLIALSMSLRSLGVHVYTKSACLSYLNPCNFGDCIDYFNYYICNCDLSPYNGANCENEVGVLFYAPSSSLTYYFNVLNNVYEFFISISFRTTSNGLLYLIQGADRNVFIMVDLHDNNLRIRMNLWQKRTMVPNVFKFAHPKYGSSLTDGNTHVVQFKFKDFRYVVYIDGHFSTFTIPVSSAQDLIFKNPRWVYLGKPQPIPDFKTVTSNNFDGCMGGMKIRFKYQGQVEYDVIDILKAAGGANAKNVGHSFVVGTCVGNLSAPPPAKLIDLPLNLVPGRGGNPDIIIRDPDNSLPVSITQSWNPVIVALLILLAFMMILGSMLFLRWYRRNHGVYITQEGTKLMQQAEKINSRKKETLSTALPNIASEEMEGWYL